VAVFRSESIEYFPGMDSEFLLKSFVAILVAPIITGMMIHYYYCYCCCYHNFVVAVQATVNTKIQMYHELGYRI